MTKPLSYGDLIRRGRELKGWTQEEFADVIDVGASTISNWENQRIRPSIEQGNQIIMALNVAPDDFWRSMGCLVSPSISGRLSYRLVKAIMKLSPERQRSLAELLSPESTDADGPEGMGE